MSRIVDLGNPGPAQGYTTAAGPTASVGAAPSVLTSFALVSLDFTGSTDPAGGGLTYSCTLDVKPTSSATTLVDATTSTPDFTPDKIGAYSGVLTVTDINGRTDTSRWFREVRSALSVSIAAVSDQLTLTAATLDSTVTGGVTPYTYAWTVDGATTGLSSSTAADPTYTPTAAGTPTAVVTVTDAAGQTARASVTWRVGTTKGWVRWWTALASEMVDYNWSTAPNYLTHNGVSIARYLTGTFDSLNVTSGVWTIDTAAGTDGGVFGRAYLALAGLTNLRADVSIAIVAGVGANLTADNDGFSVEYANNAISKGVRQCARRSGGVQQTGVGDFTGVTFKNTSGGSQVRQQCLVLGPQRLSAKGLYSPTSWSGSGLAPDDASWALAGGTASGWWQPNETVTDAATDDIFDPDVEADPTCDYWAVRFEGDNGRAYTLAGVAMWVRFP